MTTEEQLTASDYDLVARILAGEGALYELVMRRYNQRLFRVIRSVLRDEGEAEEVLQESWVRIYQYLGQFAHRSSFSTWITRIALHEALGHVRKGRRWTPMEDATGDVLPSVTNKTKVTTTPEDLAMRGELRGLLESAIDLLPEMYRTVFLLRDVEGLSTEESAQCLDVTQEAIKTRLHRARAMLRRSIEAQLGPSLTETYSFMGGRCDRTVAAVLARLTIDPVLNAK